MVDFTDLLSRLPIDRIAAQLGEDRDQTYQAASAAIPALLGGMKANAEDPNGAASLMSALQDHQRDVDELDVDQVDTEDGQKIVRNVFGENTDAVVNQFSGMGFSGGLVGKLLPMLAPFVLGWLSKNIFGSGRQQAPAPAPRQQESGGGGLGDLLGGIFGKKDEPAPTPTPRQVPQQQDVPGGININDILGDMLGGGRSGGGGQAAPRQQQSPLPGGLSLDDLLGGLGGLLGGGRR
ncbi:MAG: DUF937 domain-containing protein [bacterium]|nr:DUF937 domain-containing protein [bacterium]